jgi:DNA (cytosine-5)-methyltransferase 1
MGADDFKIDHKFSLDKALFQVSDAVYVSVIEWIARNYLDPLLSELSEEKPMTTYKYGRRKER